MERSLAAVHVDAVSVSYDGEQNAVDNVSFEVVPGSITALLGPSGCGKTSLLRAIAGLERPTSGSIRVGDHDVSSPTRWIKPEHRNIGMVFQDGALFPHLTVAENIEFGLKAAVVKASASERTTRVLELLELVDLVGLGNRHPDTLSGGQQQRVALARSLAPNPSVLLLDEPFSALDAGLRIQVRAEVVRILREIGVTSIFVTHDQDEAFVLGDRVAVMRDGQIEQIGSPDEARNPLGGTVDVLVRPEQVALDAGDSAEITTVEYYGHDVRYELLLADGSTLSARTHPDRLRERGERVNISFDGDAVTTVFPG
jgi:iron(III) transport system ATP-binding protein